VGGSIARATENALRLADHVTGSVTLIIDPQRFASLSTSEVDLAVSSRAREMPRDLYGYVRHNYLMHKWIELYEKGGHKAHTYAAFSITRFSIVEAPLPRPVGLLPILEG
jgi:hypothetical protein